MIATIADAAVKNLIFSIAFIFLSRHYNMFTPPEEDDVDHTIPLIASLTILGLMIGYHFLQ
jgi:hypothetical protein